LGIVFFSEGFWKREAVCTVQSFLDVGCCGDGWRWNGCRLDNGGFGIFWGDIFWGVSEEIAKIGYSIHLIHLIFNILNILILVK
jgi:hypothetical protein